MMPFCSDTLHLVPDLGNSYAAIGATNNDGQILISEYDKAWYEFQCKILTVLAVVVVAVVEEKDAV